MLKYQEQSIKSRFKYHDINIFIDEIEKVYSESNIKFDKNSQLSKFLKNARKLAKSWEQDESNQTDMSLLFTTLHIERIANVIRELQFETQKNKYLKDLLKGTLNFFERKQSHAKSILWELEVWTKIKKSIPETYLDEPDLVVPLDATKIAISCKKIFSEKSVEKVLSKAVSQIEKNNFQFGIVAINIDDLLPINTVLNAKTSKEAADKLHNLNLQFLNRHERHFLKYFSESRIIGVIISSSIISDIHNESPKFNNFHQWTMWTIPNLNSQHHEQIRKFSQKIIM